MMRLWMRGWAVAVLLVAVPAAADVRLTQTSSGKMMGMSHGGETITSVKGLMMRNDMAEGETSVIVDVEGHRMISLDHGRKRADVMDLSQLSATLEKVGNADMDVSIDPNGGTREILDQVCDGFDLSVTVTMMPGTGQDLRMVMSGPVWIAKDAPGRDDFTRLYQAMAERGLFLGDPRMAQAQPGQAKGMTAMYERMASLGVPYETELTMKMEGGGGLGKMLAGRMGGGGTSTNTVTSISTAPLSDDLFTIPEGYEVREVQ